jgi:NMD protein affecting ribosome stability and mRNA decay
MKFCAKCGAKGETKEGLCERCYSELNPALKAPEKIKIQVCEGCDKFLHRNLWNRYPSIKDAVESILKDSIKVKPGNKIKIKASETEDGAEAEIRISGRAEKHKVDIELEESVCHKCRKLIGKYFEGTLQLRDVDDKVLDYVAKDIESNADNGVFVKDMVEHKNGLDMNITSRKYLMALGKKLRVRFGGTVKKTSRLFSKNKQTSKDVHRLTLLYRGKSQEKE